ncbi:MAG TPA: M1 family aminopeptidase [Thermoanaerobaculia bacterium]
MLIKIAQFELRYLMRNPLLWITAAFGFTMVFLSMNVDGFELGSEGGLLRNSAYATLRNALMFSMIFMFVSTAFVANAVIRDDETGYGPIVRSTPITKLEYVFGRYLGAFAAAALAMMAVPLGSFIGSLMPWANPANLGPNRLSDHLYAYFVIALPNIFLHSSVFFALATITRSMMAAYLGVVSFVAAFITLSEGGFERPQVAMTVGVLEPFASRALRDATRYWTLPERNTLLPDLAGALLYNRLLWISVATICLAIAYAAFRSADQGMSKRERKKQKLEQTQHAASGIHHAPASLPAPHYNSAAARALLWMRTRFEARQIIRSATFPVLLAWGLFSTISNLLMHRGSEYWPAYPTTLSLIPEIEEAFRLIPLVVAIYYAGELVWRERDRRVHELIDASPIPGSAYVIPKTAALALVFLALLLVNVIASIALQLSLGFTDLELGKYVLWYVLPTTVDMLLLAALAIFVQSLSAHKTIGWGVMTLFLIWNEQNKYSRFVNHNLLNYGETPKVPLSDLNGAAAFWVGAWMVRLYWAAFAFLLLHIAYLLWRRGAEIRLKPRVVLAWRRLAGPPGRVAAAALLMFVATGAYAVYNINFLNRYRTADQAEADLAEYEKRFMKYAGMPHPSLDELKLDIDLDPDERRVVTKGRYLLGNRTAQPISEFHVRLLEPWTFDLTSVHVDDARMILNDARYDYRIYRLDKPMQPGEQRVLTFETERRHRGFGNGKPPTGIVPNGTFLNEKQLMPALGMSPESLLFDPEKRRKYGLPETVPPPAKLEDVAATFKMSFEHSWMTKSDITLSTDADQTPIAPGKKVSDVTKNGRRTARFVSTAPSRPEFSIQSARYAEKHRRYRGVDFSVFYHPRHEWNVDRMLDAMAGSLDYYVANFGPYQFDHFRIVEFPAYAGYAAAFAGTIPFSESAGFLIDYNQPDTIDFVSGMTSHEFAHQWFPHQMLPAEVEGYSFLGETLAQYSAHMVIKKLRGEDQIRRYLQFELDSYLGGRAWATDEPTLSRVLGGESYVAYRKGALVMYLLQKRLGEDAVNRALRNVLAHHRFRGAPYARTLDFIAAFRAEADTPEEQALITDLFERITLYDLETDSATVAQRADGKWDVTIAVDAKKHYADSQGHETETPLNESIEVGLFTALPGLDTFNSSNVILMERRPIHSGRQVLKFVTDRKPAFAGVDPYNFYIDRDSGDNVVEVR